MAATNSAPAFGIHHSFTSHGFRSFFHYITNGAVCDVIHGFQADQLSVAACIVQPEPPCGAGGGTDFGLHIPGHFAISVLLLFPVRCRLHSFCDKTFRNACNRSAAGSVGLLNTIYVQSALPGF